MSIRPLPSAEETAVLGLELARWLQARPGAVVYLRGPLGSGKTTLARGILRGLGVEGPIRSPTYTLMEPYEVGGQQLLHLDLYRLTSPIEAEQLGLRDFPPQSTWWLVEWPERALDRLPVADVSVELAHAGTGRLARIDGGD